MSNIVTGKLYGRMGNNMFQIAAMIGYAKTYGLEIRLPRQMSNPEYKPLFAHLPQFNPAPGGPDIIYNTYNEPHHHFAEIPFLKNVELNGYWQSEKYFVHAREDVLNAFWHDQTPITAYNGCVGVHIRRGDYLQFQNQFPVLPLEYYQAAMDEFPRHAFFIYSDDINWCKQQFIGERFSFSEDTNPWHDIISMASCDHQIIANSSFSWWAAWLNQNPDKKVIAPLTWFGPGNAHLNTKDVIPELWIKL